MINPFDYLNAINAGRDCIRGSENPELAEKGYSPFMINRGLSYFQDTIHLANMMNTRTHLPHLLQNDFFINTIRPRKRFSKWHKKNISQKIELVSEYFEYSYEQARRVVDVLSDEDFTTIKKELERGGKK